MNKGLSAPHRIQLAEKLRDYDDSFEQVACRRKLKRRNQRDKIPAGASSKKNEPLALSERPMMKASRN
jgi:hypothetical protein